MDFYDVLRTRKSVRSFRDDAIPQVSLDKIAEAVQLAPSACNKQPWSFRVVIDLEMKEKICSVYTADWLKEAPAIVVGLANMDACWRRLEGNPIADIDMGIAMEHLILAAAAEGLGTCWICAFEIEKMNKALNILPPWQALVISPLGYENNPGRQPEKKETAEIFKLIE